eukprot:CAMPEP_0119020658 /NCGR_PEP_ID=MMETSP1176-20130426/24495_1 /TAXON_ID=265551 /ORGANISM="Synedropsis recta cf, Strain CCMP1620" /LENGTH=90 /DNA_ID=CAMNT_0006975113 /DNA_START=155 /DNA_END=424 /DNA_ORIENTATION=+
MTTDQDDQDDQDDDDDDNKGPMDSPSDDDDDDANAEEADAPKQEEPSTTSVVIEPSSGETTAQTRFNFYNAAEVHTASNAANGIFIPVGA